MKEAIQNGKNLDMGDLQKIKQVGSLQEDNFMGEVERTRENIQTKEQKTFDQSVQETKAGIRLGILANLKGSFGMLKEKQQ